MPGALADAVATPDLRRLQWAWACAAVGGWAFMVALAIQAYAIGGATAVGLAALARTVPAGLAAPLLGLAGDRCSRRDVLIAAALARAVVLAAAALVLDSFALLIVLAAVFTALTAAHKPAQAALLPKLAPDARRQAAANSVWTAVDNASFVIGAIAAGVLVATAGAATTFAASAVSFALAAALLARIARDAPAARGAAAAGRGDASGPPAARGEAAAGRGDASGPPATRGEAAAGRGDAIGPPAARGEAAAGRGDAVGGRLAAAARRRFASEALLGLATIARDRRLRLLVGVLSASTLMEGMVDVLVVVTALSLVDLGGAGVGWLNAAWGVGGIAGGAVALALVDRGRFAAVLPAGGLLAGLPLIALAVLPAPVAAMAMLGLLGVGYALLEVAGRTLLQRLAADAVRARAFAVVESSYWLTTGAGSMLAAPAVALAGPRAALAVVGAALPLIVLARWAALARLAAAPVRPSAPARTAVATV